jgi:uncharacterized protein YceK
MKHLFFVSLALVSCGCGSIGAHVRGDHRTYPGVRADLQEMKGDENPFALYIALDLPPSAVLDTLLLPLDLSLGDSE